MKTPASIGGHPLHTMLITIPVGLWIFAFICDLISFWAPEPGVWNLVAFYCMAGGLVGALVAAAPGLVDMASLKDPHIKRIALIHMGANIVVIAIFAISIGLRAADGPPPTIAFVLSFVGTALLGFSGWLGAEMVHIHRVGVLETPRPQSVDAGSAPGTSAQRKSVLTGGLHSQ